MRIFLFLFGLLSVLAFPWALMAAGVLAPGASFTPLKDICTNFGVLPTWVQSALAFLTSTFVATLISNWVPPTSKFGSFVNKLGGYFRKE